MYDAWGNCKIIPTDGIYNVDLCDGIAYNNIGFKNPIRYRGYYFDIETKFYYLGSRYYDAELGRFINADAVDYLDPDAINGLNLYAYCMNNPVMMVDPAGNKAKWWQWLISALQIVVGAVLIATGVGAGFGAMLVAGGTIGLITNGLGSQIGGGFGSMLNGFVAISTGISLFSFGWIGAIAGVIAIGIGAATAVFGANEVVAGMTGTNFIQKWTGMSDEAYGGLYLGLNIASSVVTIAGRLGMRAAGTSTGKVTGNAKPYARITSDYKTVQYDGKGQLYWSIHNTNHGKSYITNPHWHTGAGGDGNHFTKYIRLLIALIFGV